MWFAGIDWADRYHEVVVLNEQGAVVGTLHVPHTATGLDQLTSFLRGAGGASDAAEPVICVVETNHGLLITALLEAGFPVCPVSPTTGGRLRPPSGVKTDVLDARLLARIGRNDWPALRVLQPDGPLLQEPEDPHPRSGGGAAGADPRGEPADCLSQGVLSSRLAVL